MLLDEVFKDMLIFENQKMKVFEYDFPLLYDFDTDDNEINDQIFPCCIIRTRGGEIKNASDPQLTTLEIMVIITDKSEDMSGHKNLLITINRIRDNLLANGGIRGKFRLVYPVKWGTNEDNKTPYFVGNIITVWQTETQSFNDIGKYL
ncbi:MAG: hypothetical protein ACI4A5_10685 [Hominilimicola sp.]